jgi:hypothetical protein
MTPEETHALAIAVEHLAAIVEERVLPMVDSHDKVLNGTNGTPGMRTDVTILKQKMESVFKMSWALILMVASGGGGLLWALLTHRVAIVEMVSKIPIP